MAHCRVPHLDQASPPFAGGGWVVDGIGLVVDVAVVVGGEVEVEVEVDVVDGEVDDDVELGAEVEDPVAALRSAPPPVAQAPVRSTVTAARETKRLRIKTAVDYPFGGAALAAGAAKRWPSHDTTMGAPAMAAGTWPSSGRARHSTRTPKLR